MDELTVLQSIDSNLDNISDELDLLNDIQVEVRSASAVIASELVQFRSEQFQMNLVYTLLLIVFMFRWGWKNWK